MTDITERLRDAARIHVELAGQSALAATINAGADEIERLRARVAELEAERAEDLCADVYEQITAMIEPHVVREGKSGGLLPGSVVESFQMLLEYRLAEAGRGEPVARCTQYLPMSDCPAPQSCRENGCSAIERRNYTAPPAPTVDVDAISDEDLSLAYSMIAEASFTRSNPVDDMRAALRAIFNKGE